jgi:hypothetical protein
MRRIALSLALGVAALLLVLLALHRSEVLASA